MECDNEATVERAVTFGRHNTCANDFELKYRTRNDGFIDPSVFPHIAMRPDHLGTYEDKGVAVNYLTPAAPGKTFTLRMKVLRGFEAGHRTTISTSPTSACSGASASSWISPPTSPPAGG